MQPRSEKTMPWQGVGRGSAGLPANVQAHLCRVLGLGSMKEQWKRSKQCSVPSFLLALKGTQPDMVVRVQTGSKDTGLRSHLATER